MRLLPPLVDDPTEPAAPTDAAAALANAPIERWSDFTSAALHRGFRSDEAARMYDALPSLHLDGATATRWMQVTGFNPWATQVWIEAGFTDPMEAQEYRRWTLNARQAVWVRIDGTSARDLEARRKLLAWMSRTDLTETS